MPRFIDESRILPDDDFGSRHSYIRPLIENPQQRFQKARIRFGVIIEQRNKLAAGRRDPLIIGGAEAAIFAISDYAHGRELALQSSPPSRPWDPLSTTIASQFGYSCRASEARQPRSNSHRFQFTTMQEIRGERLIPCERLYERTATNCDACCIIAAEARVSTLMTAIGETLRQARLRSGADLEQLAGKTKINLRFLQAIEASDFSRLPGGIFARMFVKQYADALGLDGAAFAEEFQRVSPFSSSASETGPLTQPRTDFHPVVANLNSNSDRFNSERLNSMLSSLIWVVGAILVCAGAYYGLAHLPKRMLGTCRACHTHAAREAAPEAERSVVKCYA